MFSKRVKNSNLNDKIFSFHKRKPEHVTVQKPFDVYLFFTTLLLVMVGIMMIFSSSAILASEKYGDTYYFLKKELFFFFIGTVGLFLTKNFNYKRYQKIIYVLAALTMGLMMLSFIPPFSHSAGGASRWVNFGFVTIQPSEITKLVVIMLVAYLIAKKGERIKEFKKGYLPTIMMSGIFIALILIQKDLGSALVLGAVVFIMLFVSGTRTIYLLGSVLAAMPLLYFMIFSVAFRKQRILAFLDPWKHKLDSGFQIIQSFVAFKSGGLTGVGLGESKQKLFYLPEAHTDFIFSVLGEEFGMIGVTVVAFLFLFLVYRGIKIAQKTKDTFGIFLALGISTLIGLQAFINFGVVMGVLPTKGLVLPFISYGGSSLVVTLMAIGILLNISTQTGEEM